MTMKILGAFLFILPFFHSFPVTEFPDPEFSNFDIPDNLEDFDLETGLELFIEFERAYRKEYRSPLEQAKARSIFEENVKKIIRLNQKYANESLEFGINYYTDFSDLEFAEKVTNLHPDEVPVHSEDVVTTSEFEEKTKKIENFDWRDRNQTVGGVSNQGYCGCSWGMTVAAVVQSAISIKTGKFFELSEQQLCDCAQGGNAGCSGGSLRAGFEYMRQKGVVLEANYQRTVEKQQEDYCQDGQDTIKVSSYQFVTPATAENIQKTLLANGPIGVGFKVSDSFRHYKSGVFTPNDCESEENLLGWHSVTVVGYGSDVATGHEFWIAKNSWSPSFGESGFFRIAKSVDLCRIESKMPVFVVV